MSEELKVMTTLAATSYILIIFFIWNLFHFAGNINQNMSGGVFLTCLLLWYLLGSEQTKQGLF